MKKQMKRTVYEAPVTEHFQVELEGSFCGSVDVENPESTDTRNGEILKQDVNTEFTVEFETSGWE